MDAALNFFQLPPMSEKRAKANFKQPPGRPHFIKQWRKFRGLTQAQLADRMEMSPASISQIETRKQDYTQETLERLAAALMCEPADLLIRDPSDPEGIWSLWDRAKPGQRKQILAVVEGLLKATGTDG